MKLKQRANIAITALGGKTPMYEPELKIKGKKLIFVLEYLTEKAAKENYKRIIAHESSKLVKF